LLISILSLIHIVALHDYGSSSSKNENINNKTYFLPLFGEEIIFSVFIFFTLVSYVVLFKPTYFMHPANFEVANPLVTPPHIVPE